MERKSLSRAEFYEIVTKESYFQKFFIHRPMGIKQGQNGPFSTVEKYENREVIHS